jgi:hypothetical protein
MYKACVKRVYKAFGVPAQASFKKKTGHVTVKFSTDLRMVLYRLSRANSKRLSENQTFKQMSFVCVVNVVIVRFITFRDNSNAMLV